VKTDNVHNSVEEKEEEHDNVLAITQLNKLAATHPRHGLPNHTYTRFTAEN
jgi:hypothetical protein